MRVEFYKSHPSQTPYAPSWDFSLGHSAVPLDCYALAKTCLEKEKEIKKLPESKIPGTQTLTDGYTGLGKNSTTARFSQYNVLEWDTRETNILKKYVKIRVKEYNEQLGNETPQDLWVRCWVNVLRWGQKINPHLHSVTPNCYLSAHFNVQVHSTSTCYINPVNQINDPEIIEEKNKRGVLTLFPSYIPHYTTRHYSFEPRITLAMDIGLKYLTNRAVRI